MINFIVYNLKYFNYFKENGIFLGINWWSYPQIFSMLCYAALLQIVFLWFVRIFLLYGLYLLMKA